MMIVTFHGEVGYTDFIGISRGDTHEEVAKDILEQIAKDYAGHEVLRLFTFEANETPESGYPNSDLIDEILEVLMADYNNALQ